MAERRMYSKRVVHSAKFLKMPLSTHALYFHLGLEADDDGVVEAYNVMNLIGAAEDDLKVLVSKQLVQVLNEDLVTYITDWRENNKLRADRKIDSIYKDLLLKVNPDVKLLEACDRADRSKNETKENNGTSNGQPMDCLGKDSIGKYSIDKVSIYKQNFNDFFEKYPRKQSKAKTEDYFIKNKIDDETYKSIEEGLQRHLKYWKQEKTDKKFIPLPTTWLNQKRWLDELNVPEEKEHQVDNSDLEERYDSL